MNNNKWEKIQNGELAIIFSLLALIGETALVFPGLIKLLPYKLQSSLELQLLMLTAAGFAAFVNIAMAWGIAKKEVHYEQLLKEPQYRELKTKLKHLSSTNQSISKELAIINNNIERVYNSMIDAQYKAFNAYQEWHRDAQVWIFVNHHQEPDKCQQITAQIDQIGQKIKQYLLQIHQP